VEGGELLGKVGGLDGERDRAALHLASELHPERPLVEHRGALRQVVPTTGQLGGQGRRDLFTRPRPRGGEERLADPTVGPILRG